MAEKARKQLKIEDLPQAEKELGIEEAEATKGGILPYIEQDNIFKSARVSDIKDGTSNTLSPGGMQVAMGDGSVRS